MLVEFRVENHRSIRKEQVLTLAAGRVGAADDRRPRHVPGVGDALLTVAALYGANASGKSNVLTALAFVQEAVLYSHRMWAPEGGVPREPFAWEGGPDEPSLFELTFVVDGVRYEYGFATDGKAFLEEWLHAWPNARKQVWFERELQEFKFGDSLKGENRIVAELTRPNALFLSTAAQLQHEQLRPAYRWLSRIQVESLPHARHRPKMSPYVRLGLRAPTEQLGLFEVDGAFRERRHSGLLELLQAADIGIVDVKLVEDSGSYPGRGAPNGYPRRRVLLRHGTAQDAWLPLEEESHGTQTLFRLAAPLLEVIERGGVLVVDELEKSLHPLLALQVVRQFNDPQLNPKGAQLLFTTHDTNLLGTVIGEPALRRDQVWLTEKDKSGATQIYPLTDYQPRKQENVERGYLQGRYGAIPFLGVLVQTGQE